MKLTVLLLAFSLLGCGTASGPGLHAHSSKKGPPPSLACGYRLITVLEGHVNAKRDSGEPWDPKAEKKEGFGKLFIWGAARVFGVPAMGASLLANALSGVSSRGEVGNTTDPDVFLRFKYGEKDRLTPIQRNTTYPNWQYRMIFHIADPMQPIAVSMYDADVFDGQIGKDSMGTTYLTGNDLCRDGILEIPTFGAVKKLRIRSQPYVVRRKVYRLVASAEQTTSTGISLIAGQRLRISATGTVCASGSKCSSPAGFPLPRWEGYNIVKDAPHCSLLTRVGEGKWTHVGNGRNFKDGVEANGVLYFAPNDHQRGNNSGRYNITVEVY